MAEWVSHLIVADRVWEILPWLKRHEFCVGNIAPDCNIPNEDCASFLDRSVELTVRAIAEVRSLLDKDK